jgi:phosphoglycolate phosphatase-like HAD superfamily hydrolase
MLGRPSKKSGLEGSESVSSLASLIRFNTPWEKFGWSESVDLALSPSQELRGRPWPDLILTAGALLHTSHVEAVAVVGDTANDIESARRAGAGICAAVLTGAHDRATLAKANPTHILADLLEFVEIIS